MIQQFTSFLNAVMAALRGLSRIGDVINRVPIDSVPKDDDNKPDPPDTPKPPDAPRGPIQGHRITIPEQIGANFYSTGSSAWVNQPGGQHLGTDFIASMGSAVYLPFDGTVIKLGHYDDAGRYGDYVMFTLDDGVEYYSGHLSDISVRQGQAVKAGSSIGKTNRLNHTHVQIRINGQLRDFEEYRRTRQ